MLNTPSSPQTATSKQQSGPHLNSSADLIFLAAAYDDEFVGRYGARPVLAILRGRYTLHRDGGWRRFHWTYLYWWRRFLGAP